MTALKVVLTLFKIVPLKTKTKSSKRYRIEHECRANIEVYKISNEMEF